MAMVYAVCKCANDIDAFRYRFVDGQIVLFDKIDTAFTYLNQETELFKVVNVPMIDDLKEYCEFAETIAKEQKEYFTGPLGNDVFQCSPMPWVTYTHISHTNSGKKDNATPLFDWGKFYEKNGKIVIPISVQAHHSFVDGIHIGKFVEVFSIDVKFQLSADFLALLLIYDYPIRSLHSAMYTAVPSSEISQSRIRFQYYKKELSS